MVCPNSHPPPSPDVNAGMSKFSLEGITASGSFVSFFLSEDLCTAGSVIIHSYLLLVCILYDDVCASKRDQLPCCTI